MMARSRSQLVEVSRAEALPERHAGGRRSVRATREDNRGHEHARSGGYRPSSAPGSRALPRNLAGVRVLVVDDDDGSLDYFATALQAAGATVATAPTAVDAVRIVQAQPVDVVLTDIAMPGQDGYWLVHEIRRLPDPAACRMPVVATTAYGRTHSRDKALAAGFVDHLPKPVEPDLLCAAIARAAGR